MRSPERLTVFYEDLTQIHQKYFCDWRFGQLIQNFLSWHVGKYGTDVFYLEEDKMLERIQEYAQNNSPWVRRESR